MNILSIQSHVAYGHVGNAAAVFPMQRLGHDVWPINTVQFSNHTGYGAWRGEVFPASLIDACVEGIAERGVLANCDGVLSGYMGSADTGEAILRAVARVKAANPHALYCCDPVIGDTGRGVFVREGIPELIASRVLPVADIITPNQFELEFLAGRRCCGRTPTRERAWRRFTNAGRRSSSSPRCISPTHRRMRSISSHPKPAQIWRVRTPRLDITPNGAGDCIAALFFAHRLATRSAKTALERAVASVFGVLARTAAANARELLLVEAQDEFVAPSRLFDAEPL